MRKKNQNLLTISQTFATNFPNSTTFFTCELYSNLNTNLIFQRQLAPNNVNSSLQQNSVGFRVTHLNGVQVTRSACSKRFRVTHLNGIQVTRSVYSNLVLRSKTSEQLLSGLRPPNEADLSVSKTLLIYHVHEISSQIRSLAFVTSIGFLMSTASFFYPKSNVCSKSYLPPEIQVSPVLSQAKTLNRLNERPLLQAGFGPLQATVNPAQTWENSAKTNLVTLEEAASNQESLSKGKEISSRISVPRDSEILPDSTLSDGIESSTAGYSSRSASTIRPRERVFSSIPDDNLVSQSNRDLNAKQKIVSFGEAKPKVAPVSESRTTQETSKSNEKTKSRCFNSRFFTGFTNYFASNNRIIKSTDQQNRIGVNSAVAPQLKRSNRSNSTQRQKPLATASLNPEGGQDFSTLGTPGTLGRLRPFGNFRVVRASQSGLVRRTLYSSFLRGPRKFSGTLIGQYNKEKISLRFYVPFYHKNFEDLLN